MPTLSKKGCFVKKAVLGSKGEGKAMLFPMNKVHFNHAVVVFVQKELQD
jgi:hypothetical protein